MADRHWVGGANTWNATAGTKWATTSGGAGGAATPTSNDDVYFDAASGAVQIVIGTSATCRNLNFTGFTGTIGSGSANLACYGDLTMVSTTNAWTGAINFLSTTAQTITSNGFVFDSSMTFNGVGGSWQLVDNLTTGSTRTVTLTNGTLDLNNQTLSTGLFSSSNSNTRSIAFGTGNITLTGSNTTILLLTTSTGLSVTGTKSFNANYSGSTGTRTFAVGSAGSGATEANAVNVSITNGTDIATITSNRVLGSLDFTGFAGTLTNTAYTLYGNLTTSSGMSIDAGASAITFAATSGTKTITTNGKTFDFPMNFTGVGGTWEFADALTQGSTRAFAIANGTVKLKAGATSTVGAFATSGSNQKYLQSTLAGSQATLSQASGTVTTSYLSIKDIAATGGATWNAYVDYNNVDQGDNTGWDFSYSPAIDNEFPIALRSFTQPKRF